MPEGREALCRRWHPGHRPSARRTAGRAARPVCPAGVRGLPLSGDFDSIDVDLALISQQVVDFSSPRAISASAISVARMMARICRNWLSGIMASGLAWYREGDLYRGDFSALPATSWRRGCWPVTGPGALFVASDSIAIRVLLHAIHERDWRFPSRSETYQRQRDIPTAKFTLPAALNGADHSELIRLRSICWSNGCVTSVIFHSGCWYRAS